MSREAISITEVARTPARDGVELSARIAGMPLAGPEGQRGWARISGGSPEPDDPLADGAAWLTTMLPTAVVLGRPLRVEAPVPARLLAGARKAMDVWHGWNRRLRPVPIEVAAAPEEPRRPERVAAFFSGGVDSSYTVLKSLEDPREPTVTDLILLHGFDYPRDDSAMREAVTGHISSVADGLGLGLVEIETNLREINDPFVPWGTMQFAPLMMGLGLSMSATFGRLLIAAGISYPLLIPWGGHPGLDPLFSTEATEIVHDGSEASRVEKVAWQVARSDLILGSLRVCYSNPGGAYNCGRCTKCQRTLVALLLAGALDRCPSFGGARPDPELIAAVDLTDEQMRDQVREFVTMLEADGRHPEIEEAFRASLRRRSHRALLDDAIGRLRLERNRYAPRLRL